MGLLVADRVDALASLRRGVVRLMTTAVTRFVVYGRPVPKGSMRAFTPRGWNRPILTDSNKSLRPWAQAVKLAAVEALARHTDALLDGPVCLRIQFYLPCPKSAPKRRVPRPTKKPDLSKLTRCIEDALTGVLYHDDAQITRLEVTKVYAGREEDPACPGLERAAIMVAPDEIERSVRISEAQEGGPLFTADGAVG